MKGTGLPPLPLPGVALVEELPLEDLGTFPINDGRFLEDVLFLLRSSGELDLESRVRLAEEISLRMPPPGARLWGFVVDGDELLRLEVSPQSARPTVRRLEVVR